MYRRDEIDASHYPVFHQMEGVRIFDNSILLKHIQSVRPTPLEPQESLAQLLARDQEAAKIVEKVEIEELFSHYSYHFIFN